MAEQNQLTQALKAGELEKAKDLISKGERLSDNLDSYQKKSILETIVKKKGFDIIDSFLKDGTIEKDVYEYDSFEGSIFESIIKYLPIDEESIAFLKNFLSNIQSLNSDLKDQTLLGYALEEGADIAIIKCLADAGCSLEYKNNAEENYLHSVIGNNSLAMRNQNRALEYLRFLIAAGVDVNATNIVKTTPLIAAIKNNKTAYLDVLLENGANPNDQDKDGNTSFYYAVVHKLDYTIYDKLAKQSLPKFEILNKDGEAILPSYTRMVNKGTEAELKLLDRLINDGADLTQTSPYYDKQKSSLDWAAEKSVVVLSQLLKTGKVDINSQDNRGNTLLHKVCAYDVNYDNEVAKETYRKVKLLMEQGADIGLLNDADETALMIASKDNLKSKTVELLLLKKA
jgi:uncharacterized protein